MIGYLVSKKSYLVITASYLAGSVPLMRCTIQVALPSAETNLFPPATCDLWDITNTILFFFPSALHIFNVISLKVQVVGTTE